MKTHKEWRLESEKKDEGMGPSNELNDTLLKGKIETRKKISFDVTPITNYGDKIRKIVLLLRI